LPLAGYVVFAFVIPIFNADDPNSLLKNSHPRLFGEIGALASLASAQICPISSLRPPSNHTNCAQKFFGASSSTGC
jgi:hypothetical protein